MNLSCCMPCRGCSQQGQSRSTLIGKEVRKSLRGHPHILMEESQ